MNELIRSLIFNNILIHMQENRSEENEEVALHLFRKGTSH